MYSGDLLDSTFLPSLGLPFYFCQNVQLNNQPKLVIPVLPENIFSGFNHKSKLHFTFNRK